VILDTSTVDADVTLDADVCIVGSGAGGATAARELAEAGRSVVVVEEGSYVRSAAFDQREDVMYPRLYREGGTAATADYTVLVSQGRAVGGSTIVGSCLCVRPPRPILASWKQHFGLTDFDYESIYPFFRRVEKQIGARRIEPKQVNANSGKLLVGSDRLGYRGFLPMHNRTDCLECGYCVLGCTYDRKGDMLTTSIPAASRAGAIIVPDCEVLQIASRGGRAAGVGGVFRRSRTGRRYALKVRAPVVILAAGAINSPRLWHQSRLPDPGNRVGRNLRLQPQVVVAALYDAPVRAWQGIPQGYVVDEFLSLSERDAGSGYLLLPAASHPVATASMLPGYGVAHRKLMGLLPRLGAIAIAIHDHTRGHLEFDANGPPTVVYRLGSTDEEQLLDGLMKASEVSFAAGAEKVFLPYNDLVTVRRRGAYQAVRDRGLVVNDPLFLSSAPHGTLRMGSDSRKAVVDGFGEAHALRNLFVCDASIFPTSIAVPPQIAVMALAARTADHIVRNAARYFAADA